VKRRVYNIFQAVWKHGSIGKAAPHITSMFTGRPMSSIGVRRYLKDNGYKIVMGPYLINKEGYLVDPEKLLKQAVKEEEKQKNSTEYEGENGL